MCCDLLPAPVYEQLPCPGGFFCRIDTLAWEECGSSSSTCPEECPTGVVPSNPELEWLLTVYCPFSHVTGNNGTSPTGGTLQARFMTPSVRLAAFICPPGHFCSSNDTRVAWRCPVGHYCVRGANASMPCRSSMFDLGATASERCPSGSTAEPGEIYDLLIVLCLFVFILVLSLELLAAGLRRHARTLAKSFAKQQSVTFSNELTRQLTVSTMLEEGRERSRVVCTEPVGAHSSDDPAPDATPTLARRASWYNPRKLTDAHVLHDDYFAEDALESPPTLPRKKSTLPSDPVTPREDGMQRDHPRTVLDCASPETPPFLERRSTSPSSPSLVKRKSSIVFQTSSPALLKLGSTTAILTGSEDTADGFSESGSVSGDQLELGNTFVRLHLVGLNFHIGSAAVLKGLYAQMQEGQLVGLLGESGSGKSTLLNILSGRANYGEVSGREVGVQPLLLNGSRFEPRKMKTLVGFVPQAHIVYKELTVYENLLYASQMRAEKRMSPALRDRLIEMALELLGLQECTHFVCDPSIGERLSGGQMRRIGIAIELVCDPPILLLDEPTSALDAVNTRLVVAALKDLTKRGILVVASLHQPRESVFQMLEKLMLLRKGELAFAGRAVDAPAYFEELGYHNKTGGPPGHARQLMNPGDFYIEVCFGLIPRIGDGGVAVQASEDVMERISNKWRAQCIRDRSRSQWILQHVDEAVGIVRGRMVAGLRNRMLAALHKTAPDAQVFTSASGIKEVAERVQFTTTVNSVEADVTKRTRDDWMREFRRRCGGMLQEKLGDELYDKALVRAAERDTNALKIKGETQTNAPRRRHTLANKTTQPNSSVSATRSILPTNADLKFEEEHWTMPVEQMAGWWLHFAVCLKRRGKKIVRKRVTVIYLKIIFVSLVSLIVGAMQAATQSDNNMLAMLYMLGNSLFAIVSSTGAIDVLGDRQERDFLAHEAASGTSPSAEACARILLDVAVLAPLAVAFALPLQALSNMPLGGLNLLLVDLLIGWATSCFGYVVSLLVPSNATIAAAAVTFILFACFSGLILGPSDVGNLSILFWANPGFSAFVEIGMQNVVQLPFSLRRYVIVSRFVQQGIMPENVTLAAQWEFDPTLWAFPARSSLLIFGVVGRLLAVVIFSGRESMPQGAHVKHLAVQHVQDLKERLPTLRVRDRQRRLANPQPSQKVGSSSEDARMMTWPEEVRPSMREDFHGPTKEPPPPERPPPERPPPKQTVQPSPMGREEAHPELSPMQSMPHSARPVQPESLPQPKASPIPLGMPPDRQIEARASPSLKGSPIAFGVPGTDDAVQRRLSPRRLPTSLPPPKPQEPQEPRAHPPPRARVTRIVPPIKTDDDRATRLVEAIRKEVKADVRSTKYIHV